MNETTKAALRSLNNPALARAIAIYVATRIGVDAVALGGGYTYDVSVGPRLVRIIRIDEAGSRSAIAFVRRASGECYRAASWKKIGSRECNVLEMAERADAHAKRIADENEVM